MDEYIPKQLLEDTHIEKKANRLFIRSKFL